MHRFWDHSRGVKRTVRPLIWPAAVLLIACSPYAARAGCIVNPDPEMRHLERLIGMDATRALKQIDGRLDTARRQDGAIPKRAESLASLLALQAEAYGILERSAEARDSAAEGLKIATAADDPVHLQLLSAFAENVYDEAGLAAAVADIEKARTSQQSGTQTAVCLLITRGLL